MTPQWKWKLHRALPRPRCQQPWERQVLTSALGYWGALSFPKGVETLERGMRKEVSLAKETWVELSFLELAV